MKITDIQIMRGPSLWSVTQNQLIILLVDLEELSATKKGTTLLNKAVQLVPALGPQEDLPSLIAALIKEFTHAAGMPTAYEAIENAGPGVYRFLFSYEIERVSVAAAQAVISLINDLANNKAPDPAPIVAGLKQMAKSGALGPTTDYILQEAKKRNIPFHRFHNSSLFTLGYGRNQKMIRTAVTDTTSGLGIEMAGDKEETKQILAEANVPVPAGLLIDDEQELEQALTTVRFPIVTKPLDGNHGRGVTTQIHNFDQAVFGFRIAKQISDTVIIEEFIEGDDYRFLVIDYKLVAVSKRTPAMITGNGTSTIQELIDTENLNPDRGTSSDHVLAPIIVDTITEKVLSEKKLTLRSVPAAGETVYLKETANISAGGTATDVTDLVHPFTAFMAERIARLFKLNICGIDIMTKDITAPLSRGTGAVIEVNAGPGIRMHTNPQHGKARNVAAPIMDMLFPDPGSCRIPVVAVTGTNGKTTTTRLIAHLAAQAGYKPGFTTTDGIYIQGHLLRQGDCTGPVSAKSVLFDPTIDFAVLECARGGILRAGLGFDQCDISIITNVTEDHMGLGGIHTLEDMLKVKAVVAKTTSAKGHAILNADDDLVYSLHNTLHCNIALFSLSPDSPRITEHIDKGGIAAVFQEGYLVIYDGRKIIIEQEDCIPLSHHGKASHMIKNMLAATLAAYIAQIDLKFIQEGLRSFSASAEHTPGRMNSFAFKNCELMLDYAHNVDGFREIKKYIDTLNVRHKTGIIAVAGDRRDQDIQAIGTLAGQMFDDIIIRHEKQLRGRPAESMEQLLIKGITSVKPNMPIRIIPTERDAIVYAIGHCPTGGFVFECVDDVLNVIDFVKQLQQEEATSYA